MPKANQKPLTVAISYNDKVGGQTSKQLRNLILNSGEKLKDIDYRAIMHVSDSLEEIYSDEKKAEAIFREAKIKAKATLQNVDCLIIPGNSAEIDPRLHGGRLDPDEKDTIDLARAIAEMALSHVALESGMPILAICGGHQILNTFLGGTTKPLLDDDQDEQGYMIYSQIFFKADSALGKIVNLKPNKNGQIAGEFFGAHKQVVDNIGGQQTIPGNQILAKTPSGKTVKSDDGKEVTQNDDLLQIVAIADDSCYNVEAIENKYGAPIYSLQFHPEVGVAGMYSSFTKTVRYVPLTSEIVNANLNILKAFNQAGKAFQNKKEVNKECLLNISREKETAISESHNLKSLVKGGTLRSIFREIETGKIDNTNEIVDINNKSKKI